MGMINNLTQSLLSWGGWGKKSWSQFNAALRLGQKGALWLDVSKPDFVYENNPQVKTVIDKKSLMFANMDLRIVKAGTDEVVEDKDFDLLMRNPNVKQSMNEFLMEHKRQEQVYGNQFIYKNKPSPLSKYPIALWNVSPLYMQPVLTGKVFDQIDMKGIVEKYQLSRMTPTMQYFETDTVMWSTIGNINNPLVGTSPIFALKYPITNTEKAYEYLNSISGEKGAIGILSNESKDSMGSIPLTEEEKDAIEKTYRNKYGVSDEQAKILITTASLKWQPMSYPTRDLLLLEQIDAYFLTIVDHFGLNINIFSSKSATFENVKQSILQCYRDTIQPEADTFAQKLGKFIGIAEGYELEACYNHLAIFKEDKEKGMAAILSMINWLTGAIAQRLMTVEQAQQILGNELNMPLDVVKALPYAAT